MILKVRLSKGTTEKGNGIADFPSNGGVLDVAPNAWIVVGVSAVVVVPETFSRDVFGSVAVLVGLLVSPFLALKAFYGFVLIATVALSENAGHGFDWGDFHRVICPVDTFNIREPEHGHVSLPEMKLQCFLGRGNQLYAFAFCETESKPKGCGTFVGESDKIVRPIFPIPAHMQITSRQLRDTKTEIFLGDVIPLLCWPWGNNIPKAKFFEALNAFTGI